MAYVGSRQFQDLASQVPLSLVPCTRHRRLRQGPHHGVETLVEVRTLAGKSPNVTQLAKFSAMLVLGLRFWAAWPLRVELLPVANPARLG